LSSSRFYGSLFRFENQRELTAITLWKKKKRKNQNLKREKTIKKGFGLEAEGDPLMKVC